MLTITVNYLKKNYVIYSLLGIYLLILSLNAIGIPVWLPSCPFSTYLGIECFGCGLNRSMIALLQFDFELALAYNPLIFIYFPTVFFWISYDFYKYWKNQTILN